MLTEREKEIAISSAVKFDSGTEECHVVIHNSDISVMFDDFLSRIREEQEAAAYLLPQFTGGSRYTERKELAKKVNGNIPLFTTPSVAPDCSELVEALKKMMKYCEKLEDRALDNGILISDIYVDSRHERDVTDFAKEALANHDKRMKGEE